MSIEDEKAAAVISPGKSKEQQMAELFETGNSKLDVDEIYRLRANANIPNLVWSQTHDKSLPYAIRRANMPVKAVAYMGNAKIAEYLSKINQLADMAINLSIENKKLEREVQRNRKLLFPGT